MEKIETLKTKKSKKDYCILNGKYEILANIGHGTTSKVYLCQNTQDNNKKVAIKIIQEAFLMKDKKSLKSVEQEIIVLSGLQHKNITNIIDYGESGNILKPSGRKIKDQIYIIQEYVPGGLFFDVCNTLGAMDENGGRFFMDQLIDVISYIHDKKAVHRDLKLENILVGDDLTLKICDFGFAACNHVDRLKSYRGTKTYMAPEIKECKIYDGRKSDIFSLGVILFVIVLGIFPFQEAKTDEYYYGLMQNGNLEKYWKLVGGKHISSQLKQLLLKMLDHDPEKRPTIDEIKNDPWMTTKYNKENAKQALMKKLKEQKYDKLDQLTNKSDSTQDSTQD